jgi:hypothetical protein
MPGQQQEKILHCMLKKPSSKKASADKEPKPSDPGIELEEGDDGFIYISRIYGLAEQRNLLAQVGDRVDQINQKTMEEHFGLQGMQQELLDAEEIMMVVSRPNPDASVCSSPDSSVGSWEPEEEQEIEEQPSAGAIMRLRDISPKANLTGTIVKVLGPDKKKGRWRVHRLDIEDEESELSIATEKIGPVHFNRIEKGDVMRLRYIEAKPHLNGHKVRVIEKDEEEEGRWQVEVIDIESDYGIFTVKPDKLGILTPEEREKLQLEDSKMSYDRIEPGDVMRCDGFGGKSKLNGKLAEVVEEISEKSKCRVRIFETGITLALATDKLKHV